MTIQTIINLMFIAYIVANTLTIRSLIKCNKNQCEAVGVMLRTIDLIANDMKEMHLKNSCN